MGTPSTRSTRRTRAWWGQLDHDLDLRGCGGAGTAGLFPDHLNLSFNERVRTHLRHLPDPAVRPGAMSYLSNAMSVGALPEAGEYTWLDALGLLELTVEPSSDRLALGEPITLTWTLTNRASVAVPVPAELTLASMVVTVSVTDPCGEITPVTPADILSCTRIELAPEHRANQALGRLGVHRRSCGPPKCAQGRRVRSTAGSCSTTLRGKGGTRSSRVGSLATSEAG